MSTRASAGPHKNNGKPTKASHPTTKSRFVPQTHHAPQHCPTLLRYRTTMLHDRATQKQLHSYKNFRTHHNTSPHRPITLISTRPPSCTNRVPRRTIISLHCTTRPPCCTPRSPCYNMKLSCCTNLLPASQTSHVAAHSSHLASQTHISCRIWTTSLQL